MRTIHIRSGDNRGGHGGTLAQRLRPQQGAVVSQLDLLGTGRELCHYQYWRDTAARVQRVAGEPEPGGGQGGTTAVEEHQRVRTVRRRRGRRERERVTSGIV